jgi:hypothetical protein
LAKLIGRKDKNKVKYMVKPNVLFRLTVHLSKGEIYSRQSKLHFSDGVLPILLEIIHQQKRAVWQIEGQLLFVVS